ncbi:hypothetical protein DMX04_08645 [Pseudomonas koreensis]|nr:hypothetical protein DMX04_08645 [Pseudomonas koreensis]
MENRQKPRTTSSAPDAATRTSTKSNSRGAVLPVTDHIDLWYLCEKVSYTIANPYKKSKSNYIMYQRNVTFLIRADNELYKYRFPYCGEVGFNMTCSPPAPIMSCTDKWRPSRFPLSQYSEIRNNTLTALRNYKVEIDLLSKHELEKMLLPKLPASSGISVDQQRKIRGLLRIPDVLRIRSFNNPSKAQYSQNNFISVIEMKFPGDVLSEPQREAYQKIAGDSNVFRILKTEQCESNTPEHRRDWVRASVNEPVYKPVNQVMSLASRASAEKHKVLVGQIDAEHAAARRHLQFQLAPVGPQYKIAPDKQAIHAQNKQAIAKIEMTLAAPFIAVGAAMTVAAIAPSGAAASSSTLIAHSGSQPVIYESVLGVMIRKFAALMGGGLAVPALATAADQNPPPTKPQAEDDNELMFISDINDPNLRVKDWINYLNSPDSTSQSFVLWEDMMVITND